MRGAPASPPAGVRYERDGPLLRITGQYRGFISAPRDLGVQGEELDQLIARQRDYFARRGEAVEWKTRGHDRPAELSARLLAAGFVPEEQETVLIGLTAELAATPVLPAGVRLRPVTADADMHRIAAMESAVWGQDWSWLGADLIGRIAAAPGDIAVLAAEAGGEVVSAAWLVFRPGTELRQPVGRLHAARLARARDLPRPGRRAGPARRRPRGQVPAGRRLRRQRSHPAPPRLPGRHHHDPLRVGPAPLTVPVSCRGASRSCWPGGPPRRGCGRRSCRSPRTGDCAPSPPTGAGRRRCRPRCRRPGPPAARPSPAG